MDKWHEPEMVSDFKNALAYFVVLSFVTGCIIFWFGGMVAPFFWTKWMAFADSVAIEDAEKKNVPPTASDIKMSRWIIGTAVIIWSVLAWAAMILVQLYHV